MKVLIRWVKADFHGGHLAQSEVAEIMRLLVFDDSNQNSIFEKTLSSTQPAELSDRLYGTFEKPISSEAWEQWFKIVEAWLRNKSLPPSVPQRHNLLKRLQESRVIVINSLKNKMIGPLHH
jgi:hypothetical protein